MTTEQPYRARLQARMLDIADRIMREEGLAAVQARRVTKEADCSVGTLYNIFKDIDGLILAVNTRTLQALGASLGIAAKASAGKPIVDRLLALALAYRDFAVANRSQWRGVFLHALPDGMTAPESYLGLQVELLSLIEHCLDHVISDAGERHTAARALFGSAHGIIMLALDNKLGGAEPDELERQLRFLCETSARGLESHAKPARPKR